LSATLNLKQNLSVNRLAVALENTIKQHPMLRCQYIEGHTGEWKAEIAECFSLFEDQVVERFLPAEQTESVRQQIISEQQQSLNLTQGKLIKLCLLRSVEGEQADQLLITTHLLATDGVTMRIFIEDLFTAYQQTASGLAIELPASTTSYATWRNKLVEQMQQQEWHQQLSYWRDALSAEHHVMPVKPNQNSVDDNVFNNAFSNVFKNVTTFDGELSASDSRAVLALPNQLDCNINDLLLHALSKAYQSWTGATQMLIDFETHGRAPMLEGCDLTRTAGWFTSMYPISIASQVDSIGQHIQQIKQQLNNVPMQGFAFAPLNYLHPDIEVRGVVEALPKAQISFNHMGQFDQLETDWFSLSEEVVNDMNHANQQRPHLLDISTRVVNGKLKLHVRYNELLHNNDSIEQFANAMLAQLKEIAQTQLAMCA